jgi:hypothetical protein
MKSFRKAAVAAAMLCGELNTSHQTSCSCVMELNLDGRLRAFGGEKLFLMD